MILLDLCVVSNVYITYIVSRSNSTKRESPPTSQQRHRIELNEILERVLKWWTDWPMYPIPHTVTWRKLNSTNKEQTTEG